MRRCGVSRSRRGWVLGLVACGLCWTFLQGTLSAGASALRERFLQALAAQDTDRLLGCLEEMKQQPESPEVAEVLVRHGLLQDDHLVHREVLGVLVGLTGDAAQRVVIEAVSRDKRWEVRAACALVLSRYPGEFVFTKLREALLDKQWQVRSAAIRALVQKRRKETIDALVERMAKETERIKWDLKWSLERLSGEDLGTDAKAWQSWWTRVRDDFVIPSQQEVEEKLARVPAAKDVGTAVQDGLYGPLYSENIAFLFDVSGSMTVGTEHQGTRLEIAKAELAKVLENQLSAASQFNIIVFAEGVAAFRPGLQKAKPKTVEKAVEFVRSLKAGGETNAFGALAKAFEDPATDTIYLLSDGSPTIGEETIPELILQRVAQWNAHRRVIIHCIGFFPGTAKNEDKQQARDFLSKLALAHEGFYLEIY